MGVPVFAGWAAYGDAVVEVALNDHVVTIGKEGVLGGGSWTPTEVVYVITAHNPGRLVSAEENARAQRDLEIMLESRRIPWLPAVGRSRDGSWRESSVAVLGLAREDAIEIAARFEQDAIFGWDGRTLEVIPSRHCAK